jgi:hypothetical protein
MCGREGGREGGNEDWSLIPFLIFKSQAVADELEGGAAKKTKM